MRTLLLPALALTLAGCQSAYYGAAEQFGIYKRDILVDRVEESRDAQADAEEQFQSALEQLSELTNFDGGDLEDVYDDMNDEYEASVAAAEDVSERIDAVDDVAQSLFREWEAEIEEYSNARFKADSQAKLRDTRKRYDGMLTVLRGSEAKMEPVLSALKDNVMYLKHNLNARAINSLKGELSSVNNDVSSLLASMQKSINESDAFIKQLRGN